MTDKGSGTPSVPSFLGGGISFPGSRSGARAYDTRGFLIFNLARGPAHWYKKRQ